MKKMFALAASAAVVVSLSACKKTADVTPNYSAAINSYYQAHPACLWQTPQQFPVQVGHDDSKVSQFDALVDQGLLTRTTTEKRIIIVSKQENNYDISSQGRSAWVADTSQPGYGNFCYGHRQVSSIDSNTPTSDQPGATTVVQYHSTFQGAPAWASAAETQTAYPRIAGNLAPQTGRVTLVNTAQGWQVQGGAPSADGSQIVE